MGSDETKMREFASDCNTTIQKQKHTHFGFLFSVPAPKKTSSSCTRTHISNQRLTPDSNREENKRKEKRSAYVRGAACLSRPIHPPSPCSGRRRNGELRE